MKRIILDFLRRGFSACGLGPMVLAVLYLIMDKQGNLQMLTVEQAYIGIFSLSALAFVAGGMNVIYQLEQLPLMVAILIHGGVLYISYLITFLLNGWLEWGWMPILIFSRIFVLGYLVIWGIIYSTIKRKTAQINELMKKKRQDPPQEK